MSERNRDKVKRLEHELGRYQKKVGELMKLNAQLSQRAQALPKSVLQPTRCLHRWRLPTVRTQ